MHVGLINLLWFYLMCLCIIYNAHLSNTHLLTYVEPSLSTSPPTMKSRIDSANSGTISPTEIDSLKYEPEENSEEFYIDMGTYGS